MIVQFKGTVSWVFSFMFLIASFRFFKIQKDISNSRLALVVKLEQILTEISPYIFLAPLDCCLPWKIECWPLKNLIPAKNLPIACSTPEANVPHESRSLLINNVNLGKRYDLTTGVVDSSEQFTASWLQWSRSAFSFEYFRKFDKLFEMALMGVSVT